MLIELLPSDYFTVSCIFTVFRPDFTVMVTLPFFTALITPLEVTVASFLLEEVYVIFSSVFVGYAFALIR